MSKYTKRKDGRYVTKITIDGKVKYLYSKSKDKLDKLVVQYKYESEKCI